MSAQQGVEVERRGMRQRGSWLGAGGWAIAYRWGRLDGDDLIPALLATMQPSLPAGQEPRPNPPPSPALARAGKPGETEADPIGCYSRGTNTAQQQAGGRCKYGRGERI